MHYKLKTRSGKTCLIRFSEQASPIGNSVIIISRQNSMSLGRHKKTACPGMDSTRSNILGQMLQP